MDVTRQALVEFDQDFKDEVAEISGLFREKPPTLVFSGRSLNPEVTRTPTEHPEWYDEE